MDLVLTCIHHDVYTSRECSGEFALLRQCDNIFISYCYPGTTCTTETVTVTVTSDCTQAVMGVTLISSASIKVSSSALGDYNIETCSLPVTVEFRRTGYTTVTQTITNSPTTVSLTCIGKNFSICLASAQRTCLQGFRISGPHTNLFSCRVQLEN